MWTPDPSEIVTAAQKAAAALAAAREAFQIAIQSHVDTEARSRAYNDGNALASYLNSTVEQWAAEAAAFVAWRDAVWVYVYGELAKFEAGERAQPTIESFIAELPTMEWPEG